GRPAAASFAANPNGGPIGAPIAGGARPVAGRGGALRTAAMPVSVASAQMMAQEEMAAPHGVNQAPAMAPVMAAAPSVEPQRRPAVVAGHPAAPVAVPPQPSGGFGGLFRRVTGAVTSGEAMRRTLAEPQPVAPQLAPQAAPQMTTLAPQQARQAEPQVRVDFEIPAFLRRQSNN
ncbi:MAG: Cell division protein FtsZ, partial [Belnapia sp.]|nr:Cell division protein FtsZ [Belnapia sp.]